MADGKIVIDVILEDGTVTKGVANIDNKIGSLGRSGERASFGIGKIVAALGLVTAARKGIDLVKSSIQGAFGRIDTMEQFKRVMVTMTGDTDAVNRSMDRMSDIISGTSYSMDVMGQSVQGFVTRSIGIDKAVDYTEAWGNAVSFYGDGSREQFFNVTDALHNMVAKGKVDMQQMNRITQAGIPAVALYADAVGKTEAEVSEALSKGEISAEQFVDVVSTAMMEGTDKFPQISNAMEEQGLSWKSAFSTIQSAVTIGVSKIIEEIDRLLVENGLPTMREMLESFRKKIAETFTRATEAIEPTIEKFKEVYDTLEPWLPLIGAIALGIIAFIATMETIATVKAVIDGVKLGFAALNATILANPIALVVAAIVAAAALIYIYWEPIKEFFSNLWESIKEKGIFIWESLKEMWNTVAEFLKSIWEPIKEFFIEIWQSVSEATSEAWEGIKVFLSAVWEGIMTLVGPVFEMIKNIISTVWEHIKTVTTSVWDVITTVLTAAWEVIKSIAGPVFEGIKIIISTVWEVIKTVTSTVWNVIKDVIQGIWNIITGDVDGAINNIKNIIDTIWNAIKTITSTVWNGIKNLLSTVWNGILSVITTVINGIMNIVSSIWNAIKAITSSVFNSIKSIISSIWNGIMSTISTIVNAIRNTISNIFNSLKGIVSAAFNGVRSAVRSGMQGALNIVTGIVKSFFNAGKNIVGAIADGIKASVGKVTSAITGVVKKARDFLPFSPAKEGPLRDLDKLDFGGPISDSLDDAIPDVQGQLNTLLRVPNLSIAGGYGKHSTTTNNNDNGVTIHIENIENNSESDIPKILEESAWIISREGSRLDEKK